jgi:hypothetical protein
MAVGKSRRIVIDVDDVALKRRLYAALAQDGLSLKNWFVAAASAFLRSREYRGPLELPVLRAAEPVAPYGEVQPKEKL